MQTDLFEPGRGVAELPTSFPDGCPRCTCMKSLTHADYLALRRFPALDGLRAIAAVLVVFFHYGGPDWLQGWAGVQMFFVLSGFLITTLMLREERGTGRVSLSEFYLRRAFRILPVYWSPRPVRRSSARS